MMNWQTVIGYERSECYTNQTVMIHTRPLCAGLPCVVNELPLFLNYISSNQRHYRPTLMLSVLQQCSSKKKFRKML